MINDSLILSTIQHTREDSHVRLDEFSDINIAGPSSDEVQDMEEEGFAFLLQPAAQVQIFQVNQHELVVQLKTNPYQDISLDMISPPPQLSV